MRKGETMRNVWCWQAALGEQKGRLEADVTRHLAFIDRLLSDKEQLSAKCLQLGKEMKVTHMAATCIALLSCSAHQGCCTFGICMLPQCLTDTRNDKHTCSSRQAV